MRNSVRSTCKPSDSDIEPPKYTDLLIAAIAPFGREPKYLQVRPPSRRPCPAGPARRRPVGESLRGRERLALKDGYQGSVGADQAGQSLGAATPWIESEEHFRVADEELSVSHDTQIARPGEFRTEA